jgi:hypothetical protein
MRLRLFYTSALLPKIEMGDRATSVTLSTCQDAAFAREKTKVKGLYDAFSGLLISKVTADPEHMSSWVGVVSTSKPTG